MTARFPPGYNTLQWYNRGHWQEHFGTFNNVKQPKSTFYELKISPRNRPQLIHKTYTKSRPLSLN